MSIVNALVEYLRAAFDNQRVGGINAEIVLMLGKHQTGAAKGARNAD